MKIIKRVLLILALLFVFAIGALGIAGYMEYRDALKEMPLSEKIEEIRKQPDYVTYDEIAPYLLDATVSVEDKRFYTHGGIDYLATARAIASNVFYNGIVSGGSTITQQLAKNLYFGYEPSVVRKAAEIFMAKDLEEHYTKEEILELYVNVINYGDNHIGIKQAAEGYFQIAPSALNLDQASLLAGIPQSPSNYQLSNHETVARKRQKIVLEAMLRDEKITEQQYEEMIAKIEK